MIIKRIYAVFLRNFYLLRGNFSRVFIVFYWPLIDLIIWGLLTVYLHRIGGEQLSFMSMLIGTVIFSHFLERI